ncbi:MAG: hypothetical protein J4G05_03745, partial [Chlorobi bacterium]|nr:hypothetical protein [Chlorobiota bacterium]
KDARLNKTLMKQTLDSSISEPRLTMFDFRFTMYHSPAVYGWEDVIGSSLQPRRKETRGQGDKGTGRGGDKGTGRTSS